MPPMRDLTGKTIGRLTILSRAPNIAIGNSRPIGRVAWLCRCECGNEKVIQAASLLQGVSQSCGCIRREMAKEVGWKRRLNGLDTLEERRTKRLRFNTNRYLARKYGIGIIEYEARIASQGGRCAICKEKTRLHLDHCHETGKLRDMLCGPCNLSIGQLREDPERIHALYRYVLDWRVKNGIV